MSIQVSTKAAGGTVLATASIPDASPAGYETPLNLKWNPREQSTQTVIIPIGESWTFIDLYVINSAGAGTDVQPTIEIKKDQDRVLDYSEYLDAVQVGSNQRPNGLHGFLTYEGASQLSMKVITTELAAAARTIKAFVPYEKNA